MRKGWLKTWPFDRPALLLALWVLLSALVAPLRWAAAEAIVSFVALLLLVVVVRTSFLSVATLRNACMVFCIVGGLVAAVGLLQSFNLWPNGNMLLYGHLSGRIYSTMGNPNMLASFLTMGVFVAAGLAFSDSTKGTRWTAVLTAVLMGAALVLARSRGSLLGLAGGMAVFVGLSWRWLRAGMRPIHKKMLALVAVSALFVAGPVILLRTQNLKNLAGVFDNNRAWVWRKSVKMFFSAPLTGYGVGRFWLCFPVFYQGDHPKEDFAGSALHAHSEPLEIACELGIVGLLLTGLTAVSIILLFARIRPPTRGMMTRLPLAIGCVAAATAAASQSLVSVNTRWVQVNCPMALVFGMSLAALHPYVRRKRKLCLSPAGKHKGIAKCALCISFSLALVVMAGTSWRIAESRIYYSRGKVMLMRGLNADQLERAAEAFGKSTDLNPFQVYSWYALAVANLELGNYRECVTASNRVIALAPNFARVHLMLGEAHLASGQVEEAIREFQQDYIVFRNSLSTGYSLKMHSADIMPPSMPVAKSSSEKLSKAWTRHYSRHPWLHTASTSSACTTRTAW